MHDDAVEQLGLVSSQRTGQAARTGAVRVGSVKRARHRLLDRHLRKQGGHLLKRASGRQAKLSQRVNSGQHGSTIALLLTDVMLPEMSGYELAQVLCSSSPRLKHLFMSGLPGTNDPDVRVPEDAALFLAKPFTLAALTSKVRNVLDGG